MFIQLYFLIDNVKKQICFFNIKLNNIEIYKKININIKIKIKIYNHKIKLK